MREPPSRFRRYWRLYRTSSGNPIIRDELKALSAGTYANMVSAMDEVVDVGLRASKPLRGEIRQIEADGDHGTTYRLLFAVDGRRRQMLLALVSFNKKTQKTPPRFIDLAEVRLGDWRSRREVHEATSRSSTRT